MPYEKPTLAELKAQVAQDISSELPGVDPLLRYSPLKIMGVCLAGVANGMYGYLDWIAKQAVPYTATGEYLEGWAGLKGVTRNSASSASGVVSFDGADGVQIPSGHPLIRGDSKTYKTTASATVADGVVLVSAIADADPEGLLGAWGNTDAGQIISLGEVIPGIQSSGVVTTAFTGGADIESDDSLRSRMLAAYQSTPQGGSEPDFKEWALSVPGVTRAWIAVEALGAGTVGVYVMLDNTQAAHAGFPQGTNGVATAEKRGTAATGDQLSVANYLWPRQPVPALVAVLAPTAQSVPFTISGVSSGNRSTTAAAIASVFVRLGEPGGIIPISEIWSAILAAGVSGFTVTSPASDINLSDGALPTVGTITWA